MEQKTKPPHIRVAPRGTRPREGSGRPDSVRAIVYSPIEERTRWIEAELARDGAVIQVGRSVAHVVAAVTEDPPPRPTVLVIDIDALSGGELLRLHLVREQGWCGSIIALGKVAPVLRRSLAIDTVLPPPFVEDSLRDSIAKHRAIVHVKTVRIPVL